MAIDRQAIQLRWIHELTDFNAYWFHDGNPRRPYARLTSGRISNFFANCTPITSRPLLCGEAVADLLRLAPEGLVTQIKQFAGSAYGAITLAYEFARQTNTVAWYTEKVEGSKEMKLNRFSFSSHHSAGVLCEDVVTTFLTTRNSRAALSEKATEAGVGTVLPFVFAIVNRSGWEEIDNNTIISLIDERRAKEWEEGHNPFTPEGKELVPPVRPKGNWEVLTRSYG